MSDKLFKDLLDEILLIARKEFGARKNGENCVFCGTPLSVYKDGYCVCPKSQSINLIARKINSKAELVDRLKLIQFSDYDGYLYDISGIPDRYKGKTLEDYKPQTKKEQFIKSEVEKYQSNLILNWLLGRNLILTGNSGTAKTHLMSAIASFGILKKGFSCRFVCSTDLFLKLKETFSDEEKSELSVLSPYLDADILFFDDIDKEPPSPYVSKIICEIINTRSCKKLPTVVSTNFSPEKLESYWGDKGEVIVSRLAENSVCLVFDGENYRLTDFGKGAA